MIKLIYKSNYLNPNSFQDQQNNIKINKKTRIKNRLIIIKQRISGRLRMNNNGPWWVWKWNEGDKTKLAYLGRRPKSSHTNPQKWGLHEHLGIALHVIPQ